MWIARIFGMIKYCCYNGKSVGILHLLHSLIDFLNSSNQSWDLMQNNKKLKMWHEAQI